MQVFQGENASEVWLRALSHVVHAELLPSESRAGSVRDVGPAVFSIDSGCRFPLLAARGLNPFFAVVEAAWVLAGRRDLASLRRVIAGYERFSDDGESLSGAYGYRLRHYFGPDQVEDAVTHLQEMPGSRRAVLTLYAPEDLRGTSLDVPCNTTVFLKVRKPKVLDITVINRSNDCFMGVPYNIITFAVLHRYFAMRLGLVVGQQLHFTDSLHLYEKDFDFAAEAVRMNSLADLDCMSAAGNEWVDEVVVNRDELVNGEFYALRSGELAKLFGARELLKASGTADDVLSRLPPGALGAAAIDWACVQHGFKLRDVQSITKMFGMLEGN